MCIRDSCYEEAKNAKNSEGCKEVEMKYSEYMNCYENCKTKANSYNKSTKTIIVYVPVTFEEEKAKKEAEQEAIEEIVKDVYKRQVVHCDLISVADFPNFCGVPTATKFSPTVPSPETFINAVSYTHLSINPLYSSSLMTTAFPFFVLILMMSLYSMA